ncbi:MAG: ribonuclease HII, partial [Chloroflexota bacterium]|nr:ribonuclease HII [Chloroflexota bacterium]
MVKKFDVNLLPSAPNFSFETELWESGFGQVAGIDEAGRGALAGPVAAAALVFPSDPSLTAELHGVRDSKQMTPGQREKWAQRLPEIALACGVAFASPGEIDELGIVPATRM